jgi:hypothetical protein
MKWMALSKMRQALKRWKALTDSIIPLAIYRNAIAALRHRFMLQLTWRTVTIMFSI